MVVGVAPLAMGIAVAIRPSEQRLSLMRPLSLAGIFAAVSSLLLGLTNVSYGVATTETPEPTGLRYAAIGFAEAVVPAFVSFASLTAAWLLVAVGMRKR